MTDLVQDGITLHKQGRLDEAESLYAAALRDEPRHPDAWHLLGVIQLQRNNHSAAAGRIEQAIALNDRRAAYHSNLGAAYRSLGRTADAVRAFRTAIELDPKTAGFHYNLANTLKDQGDFSEAADAFRESLALDNASADAWTGLGDSLRRIGRPADAERCLERALDLAPRSVEAHYNLGLVLRDADRHAEACQSFLRAAALRPGYVEAHISLANSLEDLASFGQAIAAYDRALTLDPHSTAARFNRALALLRRGNLPNGWREYESRWQHNGRPRRFAEPVWNGAASGQKLLIYGEQGIGDEIMFASCYAEAITRCAGVSIECDPRLVRLFARSFPARSVFARTGDIDAGCFAGDRRWDAQIAAGSLPGLLRPSFDAFPRQASYLAADPERVREWKGRYAELAVNRVVGISWKGGKIPATRRRRSTELTQWLPLLRSPGVAFVNLQYGDHVAEIAACQADGVRLHTWPDSDPLHDLDGFAAQVAALDHVISVDNSTVHLAGALGVPTWVLLPYSCDWRWFTDRSDTPWYAGLRLFRQPAPGRWDDVFEAIAAALGVHAR